MSRSFGASRDRFFQFATWESGYGSSLPPAAKCVDEDEITINCKNTVTDEGVTETHSKKVDWDRRKLVLLDQQPVLLEKNGAIIIFFICICIICICIICIMVLFLFLICHGVISCAVDCHCSVIYLIIDVLPERTG